MEREAPWPLVIVGAGASGLMAAVAASRARPLAVLLLEKEARPGRKLLATGNGRCNLLNLGGGTAAYHGSGAEAAGTMLARISPAALLREFEALGLSCREEGEGRVYPAGGQANAVLDVLRMALARNGCRLLCGAEVTGLEREAGGFRLRAAGQGALRARRVVVAAGGKAAPAFGADGGAYALLRSLGHTVTPLLPALAPLKLPVSRIRGLKGVRVRCGLTLLVEGRPARTERGEALFTDYGVSGIAAMQLARQAGEALSRGRRTELSISLLEAEEARAQLARRAGLFASEPMSALFTGLLHARLGLCLLREAGLSPRESVAPDAVTPLEGLLTDWRLPVDGVLPFAHAQVTAGGVPMAEFDPATLESLRVPGLYACGEVLDVDGDCGGYNLMWAWASGLAAGTAAARGAAEEGA